MECKCSNMSCQRQNNKSTIHFNDPVTEWDLVENLLRIFRHNCGLLTRKQIENALTHLMYIWKDESNELAATEAAELFRKNYVKKNRQRTDAK